MLRAALLVMAVCIGWSSQHALSQQNEQRVALVIGNSAYKDAPLKNPANDAADIATALRGFGFKVIYRANANQREMRNAVREFGNELRRAQVGLFYFAGHGVQVKGANYLVPVGADIQNEADAEDLSIDASYVLRTMEDAQVKVSIAILDACRNNPFARSFRSASLGLAQMNAATGSIVAFATAPGAVAADGAGRNGIYTKHLLTSLREADTDIQKVFQRTRAAVVKETHGKQTPWENTSLIGDFYFRSPAGGAPTSIGAAADAQETKVEIERKKRESAEAEERGRQSLVVEGVQWTPPTENSPMAFFKEGERKGIVFHGKVGDRVHAAAEGKVVYASTGLSGYGKLIIIKHNAVFLSAYAHLSDILVKEGQAVAKGQKIGEIGSTDADSPQLSFEIRRNGKPVDPMPYIHMQGEISTANPPSYAVSANSEGTYIVRRGDTIYSIALDHGMSYRDLMTWNNIDDPNRTLFIGQALRLVDATTQLPSPVPPSAAATSDAFAALAEGKAYEAALNQFKLGNYQSSVAAFQSFLATYPDSQQVSSAQYWIGNAYYALRDYRTAIAAQQKVLAFWPNSAKVPDALLNIASSQAEMGEAKAARETLFVLIQKYPGTQAAEQAKMRLAGRR